MIFFSFHCCFFPCFLSTLQYKKVGDGSEGTFTWDPAMKENIFAQIRKNKHSLPVSAISSCNNCVLSHQTLTQPLMARKKAHNSVCSCSIKSDLCALLCCVENCWKKGKSLCSIVTLSPNSFCVVLSLDLRVSSVPFSLSSYLDGNLYLTVHKAHKAFKVHSHYPQTHHHTATIECNSIFKCFG